ncbi:response regulator [Rudaea sp.]|uniref:response regulator n=1 Tax=Rudaea sp. TaxID=2136325 RepID=UPI002ED3CFE0
MSKDRPPRILVADDDPVSLQFLVGALGELDCATTGAASGSAAIAACAQLSPDLLLLDRRMPDLGGAPLLRELRRGGCSAPAIATSAELDAPARAELAAAGYVDAVTKPIGVEQLAALLGMHLPEWQTSRLRLIANAPADPPAAAVRAAVLEDGPALAAVGGDRETLRALRGLFSQELETTSPRIATLPADELGEWLHRLRASCRYCGAARLLDAAEQLEHELKRSRDAARGELLEVLSITIAALKKG